MSSSPRIGRRGQGCRPELLRVSAAARGRAERRDDRARRRRVRPARLLRLRHRDAEHRRARRGRPALQPLPRHRAVLADARLPAHRPQPPRRRHGLPHRRADRLPRATPAASRKSAATLPRMLRDAGYSTFAVGKWHLTPRGEHCAAGPFDRWPLGLRLRALLRLPRRRDQPVGARAGPRQPLHRAARATPSEGYHLSEDLADHAIRMVRDQQQADAGQAVLPATSPPGAAHAPHHVAPEWIEPLPRRLRRRLGGVARARRSRASWRGHRPGGHDAARRARRGCPTWDDAHRRATARSTPATWRCFAGFVTAHRRPDRPRRSSFLDARSACSTTRSSCSCSDNGASAEGGPHRHRSTSMRGSPSMPPRTSTTRSRASTRSAGHAPTTTTRGAGRGPATRRCGSGSATRGSAASARR